MLDALARFLVGAPARPNPGPLRLRSRSTPAEGFPGVTLLRVWPEGHGAHSGAAVHLGPADRIHMGSGWLQAAARAARDRRPWAYLGGLNVEPDLQGSGLGGAMLDLAVAKAAAWGAEGMSLDASSSSPDGEGGLSQYDLIAFYRRHGFDFYHPAADPAGFWKHLWLDLRPTPRTPARPPGLPPLGQGRFVHDGAASWRASARRSRGGTHPVRVRP